LHNFLKYQLIHQRLIGQNFHDELHGEIADGQHPLRFILAEPLFAVALGQEHAGLFSNDDELAAVVADGVACNLQRQTAREITSRRKDLTIDGVLDVAGAFVPGVGLAAMFYPGVFTSKEDASMGEERLRIAIALMHDAGFDPWQAPEAWRLLEPKKLPANLASLTYPDTSCYQLGILNLQYARK